MITCTPRAIELLRTAGTAARRFDADARVRIVSERGSVRFELADGPGPGEVVVDADGIELIVPGGLDGTVDVVDPHDRLVLLPARPPSGPPA